MTIEKDWQKLLEEAKSYDVKIDIDVYNQYKDVFKKIPIKIQKLLYVISLMEKEIEEQKGIAWKYCRKWHIKSGELSQYKFETEKENQQLKQEIKNIKNMSDSKWKCIDCMKYKEIQKLKQEVEKLKRYNGNLLSDKIMMQKANKNLRKQIHQLTDELDNRKDGK